MKGILSVLLVPVMFCLTAFTPVVILPEERMKMSALSDKILLVEITKVTLTDEKVTNGIGDRDLNVEGSVIEVIRGKEPAKDFKSSWNIFRVVDRKAALAKHGEQAMEMLSGGSFKTGIEDCKVGNRYVVIFLPDLATFFSEVPNDKDTWRKEIRPRVDPFEPTKVPEKTNK